MGKLPIVKIEGMKLSENTYNDGNSIWSATKLIEHSKGLKVFKVPLAGINLAVSPWGMANMSDFVHHVKRLENTSLKYPIILDIDGTVCDGWHRICKAVLLGKKTIKAVRLETMPEPDSKSEQ